MRRRLKGTSFVEILLSRFHEVIKTYVKLPLINVISLGQKQEKAGSFLSKFGTNFRKHKGRFSKL
jgi:hypothetical protein